MKAKIHETARVHWTAFVGDNVTVGENTEIGPYSTVFGKVSIGDNTIIAPHVSIGTRPEHSSEKFEFQREPKFGVIEIGNGAVVREFSTINLPTGNITKISDNCYLMARSHVSHDCILEEGVTLCTNVCLGGHTRVMKHANLGLCAVTHQFTTIGAYAFIAMNATITKDIPVLAKYVPGKPLQINAYAIGKYSLDFTGLNSPWYTGLLHEWQSQRRSGRDQYHFEKARSEDRTPAWDQIADTTQRRPTVEEH